MTHHLFPGPIARHEVFIATNAIRKLLVWCIIKEVGKARVFQHILESRCGSRNQIVYLSVIQVEAFSGCRPLVSYEKLTVCHGIHQWVWHLLSYAAPDGL
jgi:hypothetical protein